MQSIPTWIDENSETDTLQIEAGDFIEGGKAPIYTSLSPDLSSDSLIYLANPSFEESPCQRAFSRKGCSDNGGILI